MPNTVILVQTPRTLKSSRMMLKSTEIQNFMRLTPHTSIETMPLDRITIDCSLGFEPWPSTNGILYGCVSGTEVTYITVQSKTWSAIQ